MRWETHTITPQSPPSFQWRPKSSLINQGGQGNEMMTLTARVMLANERNEPFLHTCCGPCIGNDERWQNIFYLTSFSLHQQSLSQHSCSERRLTLYLSLLGMKINLQWPADKMDYSHSDQVSRIKTQIQDTQGHPACATLFLSYCTAQECGQDPWRGRSTSCGLNPYLC